MKLYGMRESPPWTTSEVPQPKWRDRHTDRAKLLNEMIEEASKPGH